MSSEVITQLGVGGIFAIVIIREVFNFIKSRNGKNNRKNHNPERCVGISRTEFDNHKTEVQYKGTCDQIVKRLETADGHQEEMAKERHKFVKGQFEEVKGMIEDLKS